MTDKKELNDKELEKASGGNCPLVYELAGHISSFTMESYDHLENGCFYIDSNVISETSTIVYIHRALQIAYGYAPFSIDGDNVHISFAFISPSLYPINSESEFKLSYPYKVVGNKRFF